MAFRIVAAVARKAHLFDTPMQAVIFQCFASYCDRTGRAWPSYETLARQCNCSYRTVQRAFKFFRRKGYLVVMRRWNTSSICQITRWFLAELMKLPMSVASWLRSQIGIAAKPKQPFIPPHPASSSSPPANLSPSVPTSGQPVPMPGYIRARILELKAKFAVEIETRPVGRRTHSTR